jgi:hypothetical protein
MALVNQKTGQRQGNANYVLYKLAAQAGASCDSSNPTTIGSASCVFNDVTKGNNSVACAGGSPNCSSTTAGQTGILVTGTAPSQIAAWTTNAGYDLATGLGTVNAANLVSKWSSVSFSSTTTSLANLSPTTITHGQSVNLTIHVNSTSPGTPTGAVSLVGSQSSGIAGFSLTNGSFSGTTNFLPGGTYTVTAHYAGDGNFGASDSTPPIQVTVNKDGSQTQVGVVTFDINTGQVTSANATSFAYGSPYIVRANVLNGAGNACAPQASPGAPNLFPVSGCPTGTVTITANGNPLPNQNLPASSNFPLNSQGYTEDLPVQFPGGSYNLLASYSGDASFTASASPTIALTVTPAATTSTLTASASTIQSGANVTLTAVVNTQSNGAAPTGTVQFLNGGTPMSGTVTYTGTASSTSPASLQAVLTTIFSATASITAQYSGDGNYGASTSIPPITVTVTAAADFTVSPAPATATVAQGSGVPYTVTVGAQNGFAGSVVLSVSGLPAGASASFNPTSVSGSGSSTLTITTSSSTPTGSSTLTITGTNGTLVHSTNVTLNVTAPPDFTFDANPTSFNISSPGQSGTTTLTLSPTNGFTGAVSFACAVPATMKEASCSLSPASEVTTGTTTLTVTTTAPHTATGFFNGPDWFMGGCLAIIICLFLLSIPAKRRRWKTAFGLTCAVMMAAGMIACGGGSSSSPPPPTTDPGTPLGTYTVTVTATSGSLSHTANVSVTVL